MQRQARRATRDDVVHANSRNYRSFFTLFITFFFFIMRRNNPASRFTAVPTGSTTSDLWNPECCTNDARSTNSVHTHTEINPVKSADQPAAYVCSETSSLRPVSCLLNMFDKSTHRRLPLASSNYLMPCQHVALGARRMCFMPWGALRSKNRCCRRHRQKYLGYPVSSQIQAHSAGQRASRSAGHPSAQVWILGYCCIDGGRGLLAVRGEGHKRGIIMAADIERTQSRAAL